MVILYHDIYIKINTQSPLVSKHISSVLSMAHLYGSAPLRGRDHLWGQHLWRVNPFTDLLLDEIHRQRKLIFAQLPHLPRVCQSPAKRDHTQERVSLLQEA